MMRPGTPTPISSALRRASLIYPQPVAIACGRVIRGRSQAERLDGCLRAGEVLARYLAAVALSSFAAREGGEALNITPLDGNLSFGRFLAAAQQVSNIAVPHPAAPYLDAGFKPKKKQDAGVTDASLVSILTLRNSLGHQLHAMSERQAQTILESKRPDALLVDALNGVNGLLSLPLFVVEEQQLVQRVIRARRLLLMGESADPAPDEVELAEALHDTDVPYVAVGATILRLPPLMIWDLVQQRANTRLLFLDRIAEKTCEYKTVEGDETDGPPERVAEIANLCAGAKRTAERVQLRDGRHLAREWGERSRLIEETGARGEGLIPWDLLDSKTISWFVKRLQPGVDSLHAEIVCEQLLDGRTSINAHERRQLVLLFGTEAAAREELRRDVMDLQLISDPQKRWDDRLQIERANLFSAIQQAIGFLAKYISSANLSEADLSQGDGPPDYLAMREALINIFIHQDYGDQQSCASIIIRPDETNLFNPGYSLTAIERLEEGGGHQARNPLVARALRLMGFAEVAGSGLRVLHAAWRGARRPPPTITSDRNANSFNLTLSWRPIRETYDELWLKRGVKVSSIQAKIIECAKGPGGMTAQMLGDALRISSEALQADISHLLHQALIERDGDHLVIAAHWKGLS